MQNKIANSTLAHEQVLDHEQIIDKLQEMLRPSGWHNLLKGFLVSEDFENIIKTLKTYVADNKRFTPPLRQVFRAFQECPIAELKVVFVGQDPYPQMGVADGIAFSCSNTMKPEASLRYMQRAIIDTVYQGKMTVKELSPDLSNWSRQGVLMLNTSLTTEIGKIGKHLELWKSLIGYLFDMLNTQKKDIIWVFLGKKAQEYSDLIGDHHIKLYASHPASAAYQREQHWNCEDIFNKVNNNLRTLGKPEINWQ